MSGGDLPGLTPKDVACVQQGRVNPIRTMDVAEAIGGIQMAVKYIAPTFGARQVVTRETLRECGTIAMEQFSDLALVEILQAYRLWAAARFESLEMYGGAFNATQFARVLADYRTYREQVKQNLARQENKERAEQEKAAQKIKFQQQHQQRLARFPQDVHDAINNDRFQMPQQIPVTWYDMAEHNNMLELPRGYKRQMVDLAKVQVESGRARQLKDSKNIFANRSLRQHFESVGMVPVWNRAKQLILWTLLLGRELPGASTEEE